VLTVTANNFGVPVPVIENTSQVGDQDRSTDLYLNIAGRQSCVISVETRKCRQRAHSPADMMCLFALRLAAVLRNTTAGDHLHIARSVATFDAHA